MDRFFWVASAAVYLFVQCRPVGTAQEAAQIEGRRARHGTLQKVPWRAIAQVRFTFGGLSLPQQGVA